MWFAKFDGSVYKAPCHGHAGVTVMSREDYYDTQHSLSIIDIFFYHDSCMICLAQSLFAFIMICCHYYSSLMQLLMLFILITLLSPSLD